MFYDVGECIESCIAECCQNIAAGAAVGFGVELRNQRKTYQAVILTTGVGYAGKSLKHRSIVAPGICPVNFRIHILYIYNERINNRQQPLYALL